MIALPTLAETQTHVEKVDTLIPPCDRLEDALVTADATQAHPFSIRPHEEPELAADDWDTEAGE